MFRDVGSGSVAGIFGRLLASAVDGVKTAVQTTVAESASGSDKDGVVCGRVGLVFCYRVG